MASHTGMSKTFLDLWRPQGCRPVLQPLGRHGEIDDGGADLELRHEMGVGQLGCDIELERWVVIHFRVPQLEQQPTSRLVHL